MRTIPPSPNDIGADARVIYANQAATSWPKPSPVLDAMDRVARAFTPVIGRELDGWHATIAGFLGVSDPTRLQLTTGCTSALALAFSDLQWSPDDVVITSSLEHHALSRQAIHLTRDRGVRYEAAPYRPGVPIDLEFVENRLRSGGVRMVACTMASNVTGEVLPIAELSALAHTHGALLLVDVAQTAGVIPLDLDTLGADLVVFAGHKGLLGPTGVGGLYAAPGVEMSSPSARSPYPVGDGPRVDESFPSWCDAGSATLPSIAGLAAAIEWMEEQGVEEIQAHLARLTGLLLGGLAETPEVTICGDPEGARIHAVAITVEGSSSLDLAKALRQKHRIYARGGTHCSPMAHEALGLPGGTLRFSFSPFASTEEVEEVVAAVANETKRP